MVIGIVAAVWAIIPLVGAAAWWLALVGLVLSLVAFFMAKSGGNTKRGGMLAGIILNAVALALAIFWIYKIASAATMMFDTLKDANIEQQLEESLKQMETDMQNSLDSAANVE